MQTSQLATSFVAGDQIAVNLVATRPDGTRQSVQAFFNHLGKRTDALGKAVVGSALNLGATSAAGNAPVFNTAAYTSLINQGKTQAAEAMKIQFEIDLVEFETAGGSANIGDALRKSVFAWAKAEHNVSETDHDGPVIKPEQVIVKNVLRATPTTPGIFAVQLAPSWG